MAKAKQKEILTLNPKKSIKQSNNLIEAKYKLTAQEQKLVIAICSQLDKNAENFSTVRLKVTEFADFCKISKTNKYAEVKRIVMRLLDRKLLIHKADGGWYGTHWLQSAEYIPSEGLIEYKIDERLRPELLKLKSAYLDTATQPLMEFRRDYSVRLYFILKKMIKIGEFEYNLDFFRERFVLGKSYGLFANLKNKVLEPAIEELNEKSDIKIKHEYIREGRAYTKIHFEVELKEKSYEEGVEELGQIPLPLEAPKNPKKKKKELDEDQKAVLKNLVSRGVSAEEAERIVRRYSVARIRRNIALAVKQKDTAKNLPGLIVKFIKEDIAGQNEKAKIELEKEKKAKAEDKKQAREFFHGKPKPMKDSKGNLLEYDEPVRLKLN